MRKAARLLFPLLAAAALLPAGALPARRVVWGLALAFCLWVLLDVLVLQVTGGAMVTPKPSAVPSACSRAGFPARPLPKAMSKPALTCRAPIPRARTSSANCWSVMPARVVSKGRR